jgi:lipid-A-disaccharide synthase
MLVILPFEEKLYKDYGVPVEFVGHPLVEEQTALPGQAAARRELKLPEAAKVVALLPGSRKSEIARHLERLLAAARLLTERHGHLTFVIPVAAPELKEPISAMLAAYKELDVRLIDGAAQSAVLASDAAAVCSGTATLQTALLGCPLVVFYRLSALSFFFLSHLVDVKAISLVNLIAGRNLVKELIQNDFTREALADELSTLLYDETKRNTLKNELLHLKNLLGEHKASYTVAAQLKPYITSPGPRPLEERSQNE